MTNIVHQLDVHAPAAKVREAITTEAGLGAFWTDQVRAEPAVGSKAWFGFGPNADISFTFAVTAIDDDLVEWKCIDGPDEWVGTTVRWQLSPADHGTTVRFEHRDSRTADGELGRDLHVSPDPQPPVGVRRRWHRRPVLSQGRLRG